LKLHGLMPMSASNPSAEFFLQRGSAMSAKLECRSVDPSGSHLSTLAEARSTYAFSHFQRVRVFIEANQMTLCAEELCDFVAVPGQSPGSRRYKVPPRRMDKKSIAVLKERGHGQSSAFLNPTPVQPLEGRCLTFCPH